MSFYRLLWSLALAVSACLPVHAAEPAAGSSHWWQHAVIYEIYPRSFQDSDGDGTGDLNGITQRLGYLDDLGVDAIWIAPMYPSPQVDFGYDVADYESVDPQYGTLADLDRLIAEAGKHHIRVILDFVVNHTSSQHPWFIDSARSRGSSKHDFYVWSDGRRGAQGDPLPPNNWVSVFGGSAWEFVPQINQFYYHAFYKAQPDLNWRNPAVEKAMLDAMRFWLDRGVAGFRLDAVPTLFEDAKLRDERPVGGKTVYGDANLDRRYTYDLPEEHGVMRHMRALVDTYPGDRVLIGETYLPSTRAADAWYGGARHDELQLAMDMLVGMHDKLDATAFRRLLREASTQLHGSQPLLVFDNHDNPRSWDRYGDGTHDQAIAKLLATLLLTYKASALLYQGEEIGQRTATPTRIEDVKDPIGRTGWPEEKGRDGERTPMQWDGASAAAGFSTNAKTWLPVSKDYKTVNVKTELEEPDSLINWYKKLIVLRRESAALRDGSVHMVDTKNREVLAYARVSSSGETVITVLNFSNETKTVSFRSFGNEFKGRKPVTLLSSAAIPDRFSAVQSVSLAPFASWVGGGSR